MASEKRKSPIAEAGPDVEPGITLEQTEKNIFHRFTHHKNDLDELGRDVLQQSLQYDTAQLERDAVKVRRKLDFIVLPMV